MNKELVEIVGEAMENIADYDTTFEQYATVAINALQSNGHVSIDWLIEKAEKDFNELDSTEAHGAWKWLEQRKINIKDELND